MKLQILLLIFFCACSFSLFAQSSSSIKGSVMDASSGTKLLNTTITVLNSKDSTLVKFTRPFPDGSFSISNLSKGKFILLLTYPTYADYVEQFSLDSMNKTHDFGAITLTLKAKLLQEVLIKGTATAIRIKGDTTEFNASSYKIQPNDRVEDLLRQLPGIQVDQNGRITAQGKAVNKVLVDGEEFFGDDPTLVTRNIRADMVDKIQLFDKKSDQAAFTGIDDGKTTKTINVTLRADSKNGYFGKVDAGQAADENYNQGQAMFNLFKATAKLSAYGMFGNTNRTGLSFSDGSKIGAAGAQIGDGGVVLVMQDDILDESSFGGEGLPQTKTGGVHYDIKWNKSKESINLNYKVGRIDADGTKNIFRQTDLPAGMISSLQTQTNSNSFSKQKLDATYQAKLDSTTNLRVYVNGVSGKTSTDNSDISNTTKANNDLLNSQNRTVTNAGNQKTLYINTLLTKKFKKPGNTASLSIDQSYNDSNVEGYLYAANKYYNNFGSIDSTIITDQYKPVNSNRYSLYSNLTYSMPLSKVFAFVLNYGIDVNNSSSNNQSFNASAPGKYTIPDNIYSNNFKLNTITNKAGGIFNYNNKKKTIINFGTRASIIDFDQQDLNAGKQYKRSYKNWAPQASYQYKLAQQKTLWLGYSGSTSQPSINQLQPIKINDDPLNITLGNPDLKPSYRSSFSFSYDSYKLISSQSISLSGSYAFTDNAIVNNITTDPAGKNSIQYVNLKNNTPSAYSFYSSISRKLKKPDLQIGLNFSASASSSFNLSNNILNKTNSRSYNGGFSVSKTAVKKYDFRFSFGTGYGVQKSSLENNISNNATSFNSTAQFNIYLPGKLQIGSYASYQFQSKTRIFNQNLNRFILNTTLSKKFFKKENLSFNITGNDLLNQNKGFSRIQPSSNIFQQTEYTTIKRYVMLSLVWDYTRMGRK